MYLVVAASVRSPSRIFLGTMLVAILLVTVSVFRAHRQDFGQWGYSVLRQKDKDLIEMGKKEKPSMAVILPFCDVAYATFPVEAVNGDSMFILKR